MRSPFKRAVPVTVCLASLALASGCGDFESAGGAIDASEQVSSLQHGSLSASDDARNDAPIRGETSLDVAEGGAPVDHWAGDLRTGSKRLLGGEVAQGDLALTWEASWSKAGLRLRIRVRDDVVVRDSPHPWEDDSVEIYLDPDRSAGDAYDGRNDYQLVLRLDDPTVYLGVGSPQRSEGIEVKTGPVGTYHQIEAKIPWALLGVTPKAGQHIGIDVHVNDDDDGGARDSKLATFAERDEAWARPASFGALKLGPEVVAPGSHQLTVTVRNAVTGAPVADARVDVRLGAGGITVGSAQTTASGSATLGSCGYDGGPLSTTYTLGGYHVHAFAPGFELASGFVFAAPLTGWCTEVATTIALKPSASTSSE